MNILRIAATSLGWLVLSPVCAQSALDIGDWAEVGPTTVHDTNPGTDEILFGARQDEVKASFSLSRRGDKSVFGYIGPPGGAAFGPPTSFMRSHAGVDAMEAASGGHWLYPENNGSSAFTFGYAWRDVTVERSVFSSGKKENSANKHLFKLDSRSVRFSYKPSANWTLQISRGSLSGLDQLVPDSQVKRTSISMTYQHAFPESDWQTTLAWGRNARRGREAVVGYLLESTYRFSGPNVVFGRMEQVGNDELFREDESARSGLSKMNKLTVGYFRDISESKKMKFDIGVLASRHMIPSAQTAGYSDNPIIYMAFVRFRPQ